MKFSDIGEKQMKLKIEQTIYLVGQLSVYLDFLPIIAFNRQISFQD